MAALKERLFSDPEAKVFAVLDGASIPELMDKLHELEPEHICLYRGELAPDLQECAPYLVSVEEGSPFANWILEGWGKHWGIFAITTADIRTLRKHFRTFLLVKNPEGRQIYFRYYDPRVLRVYLPTCNEQEAKFIFGPVLKYVCESEKPENALTFGRDGGGIRKEVNPIG